MILISKTARKGLLFAAICSALTIAGALRVFGAYGLGEFTYLPPGGHNVGGYFTLNGSSEFDSAFNNVIILTRDAASQTGTAWGNYKIDFNRPFETSMFIHLSHKEGLTGYAPGDGMTFTFHNDPRGFSAISSSGGESLGVHGSGYLMNALSIEFDIVSNSGGFMNDPYYNNYGHCAILRPANYAAAADHQAAFYFTESGGAWIPFTMKWEPAINGNVLSGKLTYSFAGKEKHGTISNVDQLFGYDRTVYWGLSGATGGYSAVNAVAFVSLPPNYFNYIPAPNPTVNPTINPNPANPTINPNPANPTINPNPVNPTINPSTQQPAPSTQQPSPTNNQHSAFPIVILYYKDQVNSFQHLVGYEIMQDQPTGSQIVLKDPNAFLPAGYDGSRTEIQGSNVVGNDVAIVKIIYHT